MPRRNRGRQTRRDDTFVPDQADQILPLMKLAAAYDQARKCRDYKRTAKIKAAARKLKRA